MRILSLADAAPAATECRRTGALIPHADARSPKPYGEEFGGERVVPATGRRL